MDEDMRCESSMWHRVTDAVEDIPDSSRATARVTTLVTREPMSGSASPRGKIRELQ